jgi:hypothetical protein
VNSESLVPPRADNAVSKPAPSPEATDLPAGSQSQTPVAAASGILSERAAANTEARVPADSQNPGDSRMSIFDKNNRTTWFVVCIVLASIVGWILVRTGVVH